jgi:hypothetical protein
MTANMHSAVHLGQGTLSLPSRRLLSQNILTLILVWIIYPFRRDANGHQGVAKLLYDLGDKAKDSVAIYSDISDDGKLAYFTLTLGNHVAALDISDLNNVKRLDDPNEQQPIIGPHYVKISPNKKNLLVTGYFVQAGDVSNAVSCDFV